MSHCMSSIRLRANGKGLKQYLFAKRWNSSSNPVKAESIGGNKKSSSNTLGIAFFSSICLTALGLGCWQTKRYFWKVDTIRETTERYQKEAGSFGAPIADSVLLSSYATLAEHITSITGEKMSLKGKFDHTREVLVGPRAAPPGLVSAAAQGMATNPQGFFLFTPFRLTTGGHTVFVNRGWVSKTAVEGKSTVQIERPEGEVELAYLVASQGEKRKTFTPDNDNQSIRTRKLLWAEPAALEAASGLQVIAHAPERSVESKGSARGGVVEGASSASPKKDDDVISKLLVGFTSEAILVEVIEADDAPMRAYPIPRRSKQLTEFYVTPLTHLTYAVTWFSLSAAGFYMTHRMFRAKPPRPPHKGGV